MKTIEILVAPNGGTQVRTQGFAGPECRQASRFVEQALGKIAGERLTSEFHIAPVVEQRLTQRD